MYVFIVCGKTDLRKGIDDLTAMIAENYNMDLFDDSLFLFCACNDKFKGLYWDGEGFILLYKCLENGGLRWSRYREDTLALTKSQIKALLEGISPLPQKRIRLAIKGSVY